MSMTYRETAAREAVAYGGMIDAVGGVATMVLAVCGLAGVHPTLMTAIATIIFGIALMVQGGTILSDYAQITFPSGAISSTEEFGGSSLSVVFLVGAAGIVLGVLAVLSVHPAVLTPIATIAFGSALALSSNAVWRLYAVRRAAAGEMQPQLSGSEMLASEMASGSGGIQAVAGVTAILLGLIAVAGSQYNLTVNLAALLVIGATLVLTGSTLSTTVLSFMKKTP